MCWFELNVKSVLTSIGYRRDIPCMLGTYIPPVYAPMSVRMPVPASVRVPEKTVSSGIHKYRHPTLRKVRYDINTRIGHFGKLGKTLIPAPDTSECSGWHHYQYRTLQQAHTTSILVPDTSVCSVRYWYRHRRYRYRLSYRYRRLHQDRHHINNGKGHFGMFGTASIPVPGVPASYPAHYLKQIALITMFFYYRVLCILAVEETERPQQCEVA